MLEKLVIVGALFIFGLPRFLLTAKQKFLLTRLASFSGTASQFAETLDLPRSTIFHNIRILRKLGLISFGGKKIELNIELNEPIAGIVGGFGPETTVQFFSKVIKLARKKLGVKPKVVIVSANVPNEIEKEAISKSAGAALPFAKECIIRLNSAGVSFITIPCNTLHKFIREFWAMSAAPVLSIIDETIAEIKRRNISCVGLLGTNETINSEIFQTGLSKENIKNVIPNQKEQETVLDVIGNVLRAGESNEADAKKLKCIIRNLKLRGAQAIVLACTDLQLILSDVRNTNVIDTLDVLAHASVNLLSKNPVIAKQEHRNCKAILTNPLVAQWPEHSAVDGEAACSNQAQRTIKAEKYNRQKL